MCTVTTATRLRNIFLPLRDVVLPSFCFLSLSFMFSGYFVSVKHVLWFGQGSPNSPLLKAAFLPMAFELGIVFKRWGHVKGENFLRYVFDEDTETLTPFSCLLPSCLEKSGFAIQ